MRDLVGNQEADKLTNSAAAGTLTDHIEYDAIAKAMCNITSIAQNMMAHIWCAHRGYFDAEPDPEALCSDLGDEEDPFEHLMREEVDHDEPQNVFDDIDWNGIEITNAVTVINASATAPLGSSDCHTLQSDWQPATTDAATRIAAFRARRAANLPLRVSPPQQVAAPTTTTTPTPLADHHNDNNDDEHNNEDDDSGNANINLRASNLLPGIREQVPLYQYNDTAALNQDIIATALPVNLDNLPVPFVRYQNAEGITAQVRFKRIWWQPVVWFLSQLTWSRETHGSNLATRRQNSSTWVELAISCHLQTNGAAAPNGASLIQAAAIMRTAFSHLYRVHGLLVNGKTSRTNHTSAVCKYHRRWTSSVSPDKVALRDDHSTLAARPSPNTLQR